jgi:2-(1,2-epoxy-1,2-dihydrophenyl)acetyl-CoA isomerase
VGVVAADRPDDDDSSEAGPPLVAETRNRVRWLRLNRPAQLNAMTRGMADTLRAELAGTATDDAVRVLVLTGTGRAFSAGADRKEVLDGPDATIREKRSTPLWPVDELFAYPKPIIACLNGAAYGGGATLAMAADLRVASSAASLTFNLVKVGLSPEFGSSYLLWRQVGYATALELMLTGRTVSATEALALRLVNRVVDADPDDPTDATAVMTATETLAEELAALPASAVAATKAVLRGGLDASFDEARTNELRSLAHLGKALAARRTAPGAEP